MKKYIAITILAIVGLIGSVNAGQDYKATKNVIEDKSCLFRDNEVQLDLFGSGAFYQSGRPGWGGGVGVNVFFARYFGVGVEQGLIGRNDNGSSSYAEWNTLGSLYLRYPICAWNLAPYAMVGGGAFYGSAKNVGVGHVGGGLEYRFTKNIGIFSDARWLFTGNGNDDQNGAIYARAGLKFAF
jgi:hypothetical protein